MGKQTGTAAIDMARLATGIGIVGVFALSLTLGAAQFALGRDLSEVAPPVRVSQDAVINRATKSDRAAVAAAPAPRTDTIALRLGGLSNMSVLLRVPAAQALRALPKAQSTFACEPVVSVLTAVAKQLPPGRCIT
jgi:hypothetical protein